MHLLADANADLLDIYPEYPLALVLLSVGCIVTLGIDQIALTLMSLHFENMYMRLVRAPEGFEMTSEQKPNCEHYTCALD